MRTFLRLAMLVALIQLPNAARAADVPACLKTNCEGKAQTCFAAAFAERESCTKAARQTCDKVPMSQKFRCLRSGLELCSKAKRTQDAECTGALKSCLKTCDAAAAKAPVYWCSAERNGSLVSGFCLGQPGGKTGELWEDCARRLLPGGQAGVSLFSCETL